MNKRHKIFFIAAAAAMFIMLLRMAFLASAYGNTYRQEASAMATLKGELAARRGSIYDEKGQLIAWSERCYDLVYDPQRTVGNRFAKVQLLLKTHLPTVRPLTTPGVERMLKTNLTAVKTENAAPRENAPQGRGRGRGRGRAAVDNMQDTPVSENNSRDDAAKLEELRRQEEEAIRNMPYYDRPGYGEVVIGESKNCRAVIDFDVFQLK